MLQSIQSHLWVVILLIGVGITTSNSRAASSAPEIKETTTTPDVELGEGVSFLRDAPSANDEEESDVDQEQVGETSDDTDDEEIPKVKHHHHVHVHLKGSETTKRPKECDKTVTSTPYPTIKEDIKKSPDLTPSTTVEPKSLSGKLLHHRMTTLSPSKNMTSNQTGIDFTKAKNETTEAAKVAITTQLPVSGSNSSESASSDEDDEDSEGEEEEEQESNEDYTEEGEYRIKSESSMKKTDLGQEKESSNSSSSGIGNSVKVDLKNLPANPSTQKPTKKESPTTVKPLTNNNVKSPK